MQPRFSSTPTPITGSAPKRLIRWPVKKLGANMPSTCHSSTRAASVNGMRALLHRDRRRRHQQVHHAVAERAGDDGDDEHRLARDLAQRPAGAGAAASARQRREADERRMHQPSPAAPRRPARRRRRRTAPAAGRACARARFGPGHGAEDAAGQHPRDRPLLAAGGRRARSAAKRYSAGVGVVVAGQHGAEHSSQKLRVHGRLGAQRRRRDRHQQPELEGALAAPARAGGAPPGR